MRFIDDLVDDRRASATRISEVEKQQFTATVNDWVGAINDPTPYEPVQKQLVETISRFQIPFWPWQNFSKSMIYDLHNNGFRSFPVFLEYAEGASVAPASIFMHLCGVVKENGHYRPPQFDIREAAHSLAIFCYLVHIIRDFQKDQNNNLNYFADDLIAENGLDPQMLRKIAAGGEIGPGFRKLMGKYYKFAEYYRCKARQTINKIGTHLEPRYRLSLEVIYSLYLQIFERIDIANGRFTTAELNPSPQEVQDRIDQTISTFESRFRGIKLDLDDAEPVGVEIDMGGGDVEMLLSD